MVVPRVFEALHCFGHHVQAVEHIKEDPADADVHFEVQVGQIARLEGQVQGTCDRQHLGESLYRGEVQRPAALDYHTESTG